MKSSLRITKRFDALALSVALATFFASVAVIFFWIGALAVGIGALVLAVLSPCLKFRAVQWVEIGDSIRFRTLFTTHETTFENVSIIEGDPADSKENKLLRSSPILRMKLIEGGTYTMFLSAEDINQLAPFEKKGLCRLPFEPRRETLLDWFFEFSYILYCVPLFIPIHKFDGDFWKSTAWNLVRVAVIGMVLWQVIEDVWRRLRARRKLR
jgi:hypothetical protein